MDGSKIPHLRYCGPSHSISIPFLSLTSHIQKIWTKTSQIQQKSVHVVVLNHDIALSIVISTIFASEGKGIDNFVVLIIYIYMSRVQEHL